MRALVVEPEILFYDEPTTGLDPLSSRNVDSLIEEMRERFLVTSIVITHDMATAFEVADRVMLLEGGRFVDEGTPERFFESPNPAVRAFADSSAVEPKKLLASRARRKSVAQIRASWHAAQDRVERLLVPCRRRRLRRAPYACRPSRRAPECAARRRRWRSR